METAYLGCGCFWCSEALFLRKEGVLSVTPGYAGGNTKNPSYNDVCTGITGHAEVIRIEFDPQIIPYEAILDFFWKIHDPTSLNRQGHDVGSQYRSIIFYINVLQKRKAEESLKEVSKTYEKPIVTEICPFEGFYEAEKHHCNYYAKNPSAQYCKLVIAPKLRELCKA